MSYASRLGSNPEDLTKSLASFAVSRLMARTSYMNKEYSVDSYLSDLTSLIMKEIGTSQKVSKYRATLQSSYLNSLISLYQGKGNASGAALVQLKAIKARLANATSADAATKSHITILNDTVQRALVIK